MPLRARHHKTSLPEGSKPSGKPFPTTGSRLALQRFVQLVAELLFDEIAQCPAASRATLARRACRLRRSRPTAATDVLHVGVDATVDGVELSDFALHLVAHLELVRLVLDEVGRRDERLDSVTNSY